MPNNERLWTLGPWTTEERRIGGNMGKPVIAILKATNGGPPVNLAYVPWASFLPEQETQANARLMVAAPEMADLLAELTLAHDLPATILKAQSLLALLEGKPMQANIPIAWSFRLPLM